MSYMTGKVYYRAHMSMLNSHILRRYAASLL